MLELMLIYVSTDLSREDRDENSQKQPEMKETLEMSQFKVFIVHMWTQKTQGVARSGADGCWWNTGSPNAEQPSTVLWAPILAGLPYWIGQS